MPEINALRERQIRNMLATLLLSQRHADDRGGDEFGRTQGGNNNAYCQDNEISWLNWELEDKGKRLSASCSTLRALRHKYPVLHRTRLLTGAVERGARRQGRHLAQRRRVPR